MRTNLEYLRLLLADTDVVAGDLDTSLIDRRLPDLAFRRPSDEHLGAAALLLHSEREAASTGSPWSRPSGWRLGDPRPTSYVFALGDDTATVSVLGGEQAASVRIGNGEPIDATLRRVDGVACALSWGDDTRMLRLAHAGTSVWVADNGFSVELPVLTREQRLATRLALLSREGKPVSPEVRSPMPGTVISVEAATGSTVAVGDTLVVVEAMKMEHKLVASVAGTVTVTVAPGDLVKLDQVVATLVPPTPLPQPDPSTVEGDTE